MTMALSGASPARADKDITINLDFGGHYGRNIKCWEAQNIVEYRFNKVSTRDCRGRIYVFTGKRNGKWYIIRLSAYNGRIVDVDRWYR